MERLPGDQDYSSHGMQFHCTIPLTKFFKELELNIFILKFWFGSAVHGRQLKLRTAKDVSCGEAPKTKQKMREDWRLKMTSGFWVWDSKISETPNIMSFLKKKKKTKDRFNSNLNNYK